MCSKLHNDLSEVVCSNKVRPLLRLTVRPRSGRIFKRPYVTLFYAILASMKYTAFVILLLLVLTSCGTKEDPYTREQKEIDEYLASEGLNVYKAFKVSIRGTKTVGEDTVFDNARMQLFALTGYVLQQAADTTQSFDAMDLANTITGAKPAIDELLKKDEDSLPTVMQNISFVIEPAAGDDPLADMFTESEEHLLLAGLWFASAHAHPDLALYEMNRVKSSDIRDPQFKCLSEMCRSLLYLTHNWPYHAEKSANDLLAITESEKDALMKSPWPAVDANGNPVTPEQAWHQLRAIAYVLRGAAREKCEEQEKKDQAIEDLEEFVKEAEAGGMDHEVVDLAGLAVALKKEDNDEALRYIAKLESRPNLTQDEKDLVADIKTYVSDKKADEAQSTLSENSLLPIFATKLFTHQFVNLPAVKKLQSSEAGKKFIGVTEIEIESMLPGKDALDSLTKDAQGLIDKVLD